MSGLTIPHTFASDTASRGLTLHETVCSAALHRRSSPDREEKVSPTDDLREEMLSA